MRFGGQSLGVIPPPFTPCIPGVPSDGGCRDPELRARAASEERSRLCIST